MTFAHARVALAFPAVAVDPPAVAGVLYLGRIPAIVHLVIPGWLTAGGLASVLAPEGSVDLHAEVGPWMATLNRGAWGGGRDAS